jgi:hypothetical protein
MGWRAAIRRLELKLSKLFNSSNREHGDKDDKGQDDKNQIQEIQSAIRVLRPKEEACHKDEEKRKGYLAAVESWREDSVCGKLDENKTHREKRPDGTEVLN